MFCRAALDISENLVVRILRNGVKLAKPSQVKSKGKKLNKSQTVLQS